MMVMTAKVDMKKILLGLAAVAALILALIALLGGGNDTAQTSAPTASSNDARVKFLTDDALAALISLTVSRFEERRKPRGRQ